MSARAPAVALLPFENLSGSQDDARLASGFVHDLITEIARFPTLGVIAAESSFAAAAIDLDDQGIGERLGAGYLLKGSVRRAGDMLRISVLLLDLAHSRHLWAERYDVSGDEIFKLQDEIAAKVANALCARIDQSTLSASRNRHLTSLATYECWLRGMEHLQQGSCDADKEAMKYFEQALALDPLYARAFGGMSMAHFNEWSCQAWHQWEEKERLAYDFACKAEALDPNDQVVQLILGRIEQYRRQFDAAAARFDRALLLAPNDAFTLIQLSACYTYNGQAELGRELGIRALELSPLCPGWYFSYAAIPFFTTQRYEESALMAGKGPGLVDTAAYQAAACARLGRHDRAAYYLNEFMDTFVRCITYGRAPEPGEAMTWLLHVNPYRREEDTRHFAECLRLAGLDGAAPSTATEAALPVSWPIANIFRKEGDFWTLSFDHEVVRAQELRGFHDIARLLAAPGSETHCLALAGLPEDAAPGRGTEIFDPRAKKAYQDRLRELNEELAEAEDAHDPGRSTRLEAERDLLVQEIKRATGLGGRSRKMGDPAERARSAVTWRIRHSIKKLEPLHPALARHLGLSIQTGVFCSYTPEKPAKWFV